MQLNQSKRKQKMLAQHRDNYQIKIRRKKKQAFQQSREVQRQNVLNCQVPQLKLLYFINKLRSSNKQTQMNNFEISLIIKEIQQAIQFYPAYKFSCNSLALILKLIIRYPNETSIILCELLEYWFDLDELNENNNRNCNNYKEIREIQTTNRVLTIFKFVLKLKDQLSDSYFEQHLYEQIYSIFKTHNSVEIITVLSKIIVISFQNSIHPNRNSQINQIIPTITAHIYNNNAEIKLAAANILSTALSKSIIHIQDILALPSFIKTLVYSLQTQHFQLKCKLLRIIGQYTFRQHNIPLFIQLKLFDYLLQCLNNSSIWVIKYIGWIIANLKLSQNKQISNLLIHHKLFVKLFERYNSMNDKHYFYRTLEKEIGQILLNVMETVEKERVWTIVMYYELMDKIILNFEIKNGKEIEGSIEILARIVDIAFELNEAWGKKVGDCMRMSGVKEKVQMFIIKYPNYSLILQSVIDKIEVFEYLHTQ